MIKYFLSFAYLLTFLITESYSTKKLAKIFARTVGIKSRIHQKATNMTFLHTSSESYMYIPYSEPKRTNLLHVKPANLWNWGYNSTVDSEKLTTLLPRTSVPSQSKSTLESESTLGKNPAFHTIQITSGKTGIKTAEQAETWAFYLKGSNTRWNTKNAITKSWGLVP